MLRPVIPLLLLAAALSSVQGDELGPKEETIARVKSVAIEKRELVVLEKANREFKTVRTVPIGKSTSVRNHVGRDKEEAEIGLDQLRVGDIVIIGTTGSRVDYVIRYPKDPTEK